MADLVYLSVWLRDFSVEKILATWARALAEFPASSLAPGIRELTVFPFHWGETPVLEQLFPDGATVEEAVPLAAEFLHDDYAYEAELNWDVWVPQSMEHLDQWERVPHSVSVACLGPQFDEESEESEDRPQLLVNFGLDSILLPELDDPDLLAEALEGVAGNCYRENIAQLLSFVRKLEMNLPLTRRRLWSASGEDLAARISSTYG